MVITVICLFVIVLILIDDSHSERLVQPKMKIIQDQYNEN